MQQKINKLMNDYNISFKDLATKLKVSNQTLTRKMNGSTDWTYTEIIILAELFHIDKPQDFFFTL